MIPSLEDGIKIAEIEGKDIYIPELAETALTGSYYDLVDAPSISAVGTSGLFNSLLEIPKIPIV